MTREQETILSNVISDAERGLHCDIDPDELAALRAALTAIRALPVTADGERVVPGMTVWHDHPTQVLHWDVAGVDVLVDGDHVLSLKRHTQYGRNECTAKGWQVFSTAAAARAAREEK